MSADAGIVPRAMISTLAVGYDGTPTAGEAVRPAAEMTEAFGARLVLLSAFNGSAPATT